LFEIFENITSVRFFRHNVYTSLFRQAAAQVNTRKKEKQKKEKKHQQSMSGRNLSSNKPSQQESCAIAKMTAQCPHATYMDALKFSGLPDYATIPNIFHGLLFRSKL